MAAKNYQIIYGGRSEIMLIVALQYDVDNLYAIWNTVTDRFFRS